MRKKALNVKKKKTNKDTIFFIKKKHCIVYPKSLPLMLLILTNSLKKKNSMNLSNN